MCYSRDTRARVLQHKHQGTCVTAETPAHVRLQAPPAAPDDDDDLCCICQDAPKKFGFTHGGTIHVCACEVCARKWFSEHKTCPICGVAADQIMEIF